MFHLVSITPHTPLTRHADALRLTRFYVSYSLFQCHRGAICRIQLCIEAAAAADVTSSMFMDAPFETGTNVPDQLSTPPNEVPLIAALSVVATPLMSAVYVKDCPAPGAVPTVGIKRMM